MDMRKLVGDNTARIRKEKGLTQEALAWRADVDRTYMNHVENAKRNVTLKSLEKIIIHGLECSLTEFFNDKMFLRNEYFPYHRCLLFAAV